MYNKKLCPVICYITRKPVVYNEGTKWEKTCNRFLWGSTYGTREEVEARIQKMNKEKPIFDDRLKRPINWDEIDHFFYSEQEEMY